MNMPNIRGVLSNQGEVSLLSRCPVLRAASQCKRKGFMVRVDMKASSLEKVGKVPDGGVYCQELPVKRAVRLLCLIQLPGEEGEWLPAPIEKLLKDATNSQVRCINRQASSSSGAGVVEECCRGESMFCRIKG